MENGTRDSLIKGAVTKQIDKIYPSREALETVLKSVKKLTIYWGVDPTAPNLHIAHGANLFILKRFQKLGHKIVVLFGDFTAQIGDPTGKTKKRLPLTQKQVMNNLKNYKNQVLKILNPKETQFRLNGEWWRKISAKEFFDIADLITHQQLIEREMFQNRIADGNPISIKELLYPILQGYDSVALKTDAELGGTDQLFNMMVGRDLVKVILKKEKFVITKPILTNPKTGQMLMSKTTGGAIFVNESPDQIFGKIMALPDEVILECFKFCTDVDEGAIKDVDKRLAVGENPRNLKAELAFEIVKIYHGEKAAQKAEDEFNKVFREHKLPKNIPKCPNYPLKGIWNIIDLIVYVFTDLVFSKTQARRLVFGRAVKINDKIVDNQFETIDIDSKSGLIIQVGPINFKKVK